MTTLNESTVLITGAGKGIGAGIAQRLAHAGARVAVNYARDRDAAERVVDTITRAGGTAAAFQADIAKERDVIELFRSVRERLGPVNVLVNNASIWRFAPLGDTTEAEYRRHYDTNVFGNLTATREFASQDDIAGGSIVNLTSVGIGPAAPGTSLYIGTKSAIASMTRIFALELAPRGIRVNAVAAGLIDTEGTRASGFMQSEAGAQFISGIPLARAGEPDDIAAVAEFLISDAARYITGQIIFADGGQSLL